MDVSSIEALLTGIHVSLAALTGIQSFTLDPIEAESLAKGAVNVARHYDIQASQKTLDWLFLIQTIGLVYGSKFFAIQREQAEKEKQKKANQNGILHLAS